MGMARKIVRASFTISVFALGLLLFGVWTRFEDYDLYQKLGDFGLTQLQQQRRNLLGDTGGDVEKDGDTGKVSDGVTKAMEEENQKNQEEAAQETKVVGTLEVKETRNTEEDIKYMYQHSVVLSVCCMSDYTVITNRAQEYIDLFYTTSIEPLGRAIRQTPLKALSNTNRTKGTNTYTTHTTTLETDAGTTTVSSTKNEDSKRVSTYDNAETAFTTQDVTLRFTANDIRSRQTPLNMIFELVHHDDKFITNLIRQIWLSARKLEVAVSTTIDSHLDRSGIVSVSWISPHFDSPVVTVTPDHLYHIFHHIDTMKQENTKVTVEENTMHQALLERRKEKEKMLKTDLENIDGLIAHAHDALPPLHSLRGFLAKNQLRVMTKVRILEQDLDHLQGDQQSLLESINATRELLLGAEKDEDELYAIAARLREQRNIMWMRRSQILDQLEQFDREWDRVVHSTLLYEAYLLHKYRVMKDRRYAVSTRYFVERDGGWICEHTAENGFCTERTVECRASDPNAVAALNRPDMIMTVTTSFSNPKETGFLYDMAVVADDGTSEQCKLGMLLAPPESNNVNMEMNEQCPCTEESCDSCTVTKELPVRGITTLCLYLQCTSTTPFGMYAQIEVRPKSQTVLAPAAKQQEAKAVQTEQVISGQVATEKSQKGEPVVNVPDPTLSPTSSSSLTMMDWYTVVISGTMTFGAIITSFFFYYHK